MIHDIELLYRILEHIHPRVSDEDLVEEAKRIVGDLAAEGYSITLRRSQRDRLHRRHV